MTDSTNAEMQDLIGGIFLGRLGGRASTRETCDMLRQTLPDHLVEATLNRGLTTAVQAYFRHKTADGLPAAPEANAEGEHVQLSLLSVDEYKFVYGRQIRNGEAAYAQARKYAEKCIDVHGVDIADDEAETA